MNSTASTPSSSVPMYKNEYYRYKTAAAQLPPTPISSTSTSTIEKNKVGRELASSLQIPASQQKYGSLGSSTPYFDYISDSSRPVTPSQTTVSPNDNDEGLYLLWTQQLLRERGFTPSPCTPDEYRKKGNNEEDDDDDDSSVSDMSSISSGEEEDGDDEEDMMIDHYIVEQRKLFSPASSSTYAYSHRASMVSRYSTITATTETVTAEQQQNPISAFFQSCFSSCL